MKRLSPIPLHLAATVLVSCSGHQGEQLRELVGKGNLQQTEVSPNEAVQIRLPGAGPSEMRQLQFTLGGDNVLLVDRLRLPQKRAVEIEPRSKAQLEHRDTLNLPPDAAARFRARVAVFRPERLSSDVEFVMPKGCGFTFHGSSKVVIEYRAGDDEAGLFILQEECEESSAKRLEKELRELIASLPGTNAARGFVW